MPWLVLLLLVATAWLAFRKKRTGPALDQLRELTAAYGSTLEAVASERFRARTLIGDERAAALARIERMDAERRRGEANVIRLRLSLASRGYDVSTVPELPSIADAEDAALLE